jgi:sirohydrochlorin cobaltochelatase
LVFGTFAWRQLLAFPAAYLLISHGSRDPRPQLAMNNLAQQVAQALQQSSPDAPLPLVETGVLELGLPLHQQIQAFAERALRAGCASIKLLPMFLLAGVHVMDDIPAEVAQVESQMRVEICTYLGSSANLWQLLDSSPAQAQTGKILISHGSRRPGVQQSIEAIAAKLDARAAYWSVAPDLETQVVALVNQGLPQIEILPYFLFEGGITDAIACKTAEIQQQFPNVQIQLNRPIGETPQMVELLLHSQTRIVKKT